MRILQILLLFFSLSLFCFSGVVEIRSDISLYELGPHIDILKDGDGHIRFRDILREDYTGSFLKHNKEEIAFIDGDCTYWLRFRLSKASDFNRKNYLLEFGRNFSAGIDRVELHVPFRTDDGGVVYKSYRQGCDISRQQDDLRYRTPLFKISPLFAENEYIYIKLVQSGKNFERVVLWEPELFWSEGKKELSIAFFLSGILVSMVLYNLFIYFSLRDSVYLLYVIYMLFIFLWQFMTLGYGRVVMDFPPGMYPFLIYLFSKIGAIGCCLFFMKYLNTEKYTPVLNHAFQALVFVLTVSMLTGIFGFYSVSDMVDDFAGIGLTVIGYTALLKRYRQGFKPAVYLIFAWTFMMVATMLYFLRSLNLAESSYITVHGIMVGAAVEAVIISFGLAARIRVMKKEQEGLKKSERRYRQLSITDALTGLYNKRYFLSRISGEISHSNELHCPLSIMIMDVDDFKKYNDTYGHPEGDHVLIGLAEVIRKNTRDRNSACRYGGEEFVVVMPETEPANIEVVAERIIKGFGEMEFMPQNGKSVHCTVSIGITQYIEGEGELAFIKRADEALYKAKKQGKNCFVSI